MPDPDSVEDVIVAANDDDFSWLLRESALVATYLTERDSERYAEKDDRLTGLIRSALGEALGEARAKKHTYVGDDWWPDHTRHIELNWAAFTQEVYDGIRALLQGEFDAWRIQTVVHEEIMEAGTMIGSILQWGDKLVIDRALYDRAKDAGIDFRAAVPPRFPELQTHEPATPGSTLLPD